MARMVFIVGHSMGQTKFFEHLLKSADSTEIIQSNNEHSHIAFIEDEKPKQKSFKIGLRRPWWER